MYTEWLGFLVHEMYSRCAKECDSMSVGEKEKKLVYSFTGLCLVEYSIFSLSVPGSLGTYGVSFCLSVSQK